MTKSTLVNERLDDMEGLGRHLMSVLDGPAESPLLLRACIARFELPHPCLEHCHLCRSQ